MLYIRCCYLGMFCKLIIRDNLMLFSKRLAKMTINLASHMGVKCSKHRNGSVKKTDAR